MWLTLVVSIIFYFVGLSMCTQVFLFMNLQMPLQSRYFHKSERAKKRFPFGLRLFMDMSIAIV